MSGFWYETDTHPHSPADPPVFFGIRFSFRILRRENQIGHEVSGSSTLYLTLHDSLWPCMAYRMGDLDFWSITLEVMR